MSSIAYFGGFVLLLAFLAIVAGIVICSHLDGVTAAMIRMCNDHSDRRPARSPALMPAHAGNF
jgi:hypothetical protein